MLLVMGVLLRLRLCLGLRRRLLLLLLRGSMHLRRLSLLLKVLLQ